MKKILIILLLVISPILVRAEERVDVKIEYVKDVYWNYEKNNTLYSGNLAYYYVNDKIAYSVDITTPFVSNEYVSTNKVLSSNIIYKYAYFGYGYKDNNTLEDYMATQKILWKYTDSAKVYFTTKPNGQGEVIDISKNEEKIRKIENDYSRFPEYSNLKFIIGTNNIISNKNDIIDKLTIENLSKNEIIVEQNNTLSFNANEIGKLRFTLQKLFDYKYDNIFYVSDNSPELLVVGNIKNIKKTYNYEVVGGSININVNFDKPKDNDITDNQFRLYNSSNKLIGIYSPNEDGNINITNLYMDTYILKHEEITDGYNVDDKEYEIKISEENLNIQKDITLNLKKTKLAITKTYSNIFTNNLEYSSNTLYKIYDENDNYIDELITNEKGTIETYLEYGNYKIIESGNESKTIIVDKSMFENIIEYNIHDKIYNSNLKIITIDKDTNEKVSNIKFRINDKEYATNEEGIYVFNNMDFGIYKFENLERNDRRNINTFTYELNENSNVYIENKEPYVDIYLYLNSNDLKEENNIDKEEDKIVIDDNEEINNEVPVDKEESIIVDDNNNLQTNIKDKEIKDIEINDKNDNNNQNIKEENYNSLENEKVEKLPFLGDNTNENSKIIIYILNIIKFNWM